MKKRLLYGLMLILLCIIAVYIYLFYPQQSMPVGEPVYVTTIDTAKYHNDCLHPCIRYDKQTGKYFMAQSPYYGWNNKVENPMFYSSETYMEWNDGLLIEDTPETGYNSDPNICLCNNGELMFLWRECGTPLCDSVGCFEATVGGIINQQGTIDKKQVFCMNRLLYNDIEQAPVMIEHNGERYIYATWYEYEPKRKNKGVAIWEEGENDSLYRLVDTIPFESCYTVDKFAQVRFFGYIFYISKPQFHDLWHFDLFEYDDKLWMVSVAEKGDNIMLSVSEDWIQFKTFRKPLVNNHYTENYSGYRQYYYKPTAFVQDDMLHVFYTANAKDDPNRNQLYHTAMPASRILK